MFEAYKVGITIALTNHVSRALFAIGRDLNKTDAQAAKLHATLGKIERLALKGAIAGGVGYGMLLPLKASYEAAKKYEQALNQFKSLNLGDTVNRDADTFARGANVIGASATDLISTVRDLHTALGDYGMAKQLGAQVAQMKYANQAVFGAHGMDFSDRQLQAMEKIIEMKGGFHGPDAFLAQADMMQKVISGTGGMVKPSDYLQFIKTAGVSGRLLSNESFYYAMEPLIQEMTGGRVGTGTMSAYNNLAQGRMLGVRPAKEMMRLGLLDPSMVEYDKIGQLKRVKPGALKGMDSYTSDPFGWMKETLLPALAAKGITSEKDVLNELGVLFTNRTGSSLFSLMYLQQDKIAKNMDISKNALGVDQLTKLAKSSPQGAEAAVAAAWEDVKITFGEILTPVVLPALLGLRDALKSFQAWAQANPAVTKALTLAFAGLAGALLFSGTVWTLQAAFLGLRLVFGLSGAGTLGGAMIAFAGSAGAAAAVLGAAALALGVIAYHKEIAGAIDSTGWGQKLGDGLMHARDWLAEGDGLRRMGGPPPAGGKNTPIHTTVNIDGRKVAEAVTGHQQNQMNRPANSAGFFDIGQGMASPSAAFGH